MALAARAPISSGDVLDVGGHVPLVAPRVLETGRRSYVDPRGSEADVWVIERHVDRGGGLLRLAIMASTSSPVSPAAFIIQIDPA